MGDLQYDQIERTGHGGRLGDLELFANLGIRRLRFPLLWERTNRLVADPPRWEWADERLTEVRRLGLRPVVGLLHHGSGPLDTSLVDPGFPERFAGYAAAVARRYPWVDAYTPINEPLTTARFSGLYGHWYPHAHDDRTFVRTLLAQIRATVLAMRAIREVHSDARLVQTDDLGRVYSTRRLAYQAGFENERRWLAWDLLCGRVNREHALFGYLLASGAGEGELLDLCADPLPPDIVGVNYYVTSDRFLDERTERYPESTHGGNGRDRYADVEAVRVSTTGITGHEGILHEAWERYRLPLALTEVHLGCTRGDQLRWLQEGWSAACRLRAAGADVRAVTVWSLLGALDWGNLLTRGEGSYEPGAFDIRANRPRATAIARLAGQLASGTEPDHPVLDTPGWWSRADRWAYPRARPAQRASGIQPVRAVHKREPRFLLITGATGTLGRAFARACETRGLAHRVTSRDRLDIADPGSVAEALEQRPWALVNAAGFVRVDDAEREPDRCRRENSDGAELLAAACAARGVRFITISSDLVFDGRRDTPYVESDVPAPLGVYGASKAEAERRVRGVNPDALVIRTSAFFGPWDEFNFLTVGLARLLAGEPWVVDPEGVVSPTYVPDLVNAALDLLIDGERGIWHVANAGVVSWADFAHEAARSAGLPTRRIKLGHADPSRARRPAYSALGSERGWLIPSLDDALARYVAARSWAAAGPAVALADAV